MDKATFRKYNYLIQVCFWLVMFFGILMDYVWEDPIEKAILAAVFGVLFAALGVYTNLLIALPLLFDKKKYGWYFFSLLLISIATLSLNYATDMLIFSDYDEEVSLLPYVAMYAPIYFIMVMLTSLYRFVDIKFTQTGLKNQKLQAELHFLKAQVNPHFLFNTLNNIYSFAYTGHPDTAPMIAKLSEILRYMIYDCTADRVPLQKEILNLENLINLYQLKNSKQKNIKFEQSGIQSNQIISPLILISLLENAFKHGDALSNNDGFIHVFAKVNEQDQLNFKIVNSRKQKLQGQNDSNGVGLENTIRQLNLVYPEKYTLNMENEPQVFSIDLSIALEKKV